AGAALSDVDPESLLADDDGAGAHRLRLVRSYCREALERASAAPTEHQ
ncbi:MAG: carbon-monoxide dehydrogenase medium subunit, partial [Natronomonas sp.]